MSMMLNLVDRLLALGRNYQELGRPQEAHQVLSRLAGFRDLPGEVAEETQARLADISLSRKNYRKARRHLTAALAHAPNNPRYHYLMATAVNADEKAPNPERAADHYRKSIQFDPEQPRCLSEFGLLALELGQIEDGLASLRRSVELAPNDPDALSKLVAGLRRLERVEDARDALRAGLFRNPRDERFRKLWNDFQFDLLVEEQQASRWQSADEAEKDGPIVLPFVPQAAINTERQPQQKLIRLDTASSSRPHFSQPIQFPDHRHAQ